MTAIRKAPEMFMPSETVLELVQLQTGVIALRSADFADAFDAEPDVSEAALAPVDATNEPLVTIKFSEEIQQALGDTLQSIGQQMIQAALSSLMEQQSAKWHAQVMDERPVRYS